MHINVRMCMKCIWLTWLVVMLTVWRDVEIGRSVVVKLTRFWLSWDVVEMFTSPVTGARHSTANSFRSSCHFEGHFSIQCRLIQRTKSCCIRRTCHQFHTLLLSFISRQQQHQQPWNWRQNAYWRHFSHVIFFKRKLQLYEDCYSNCRLHTRVSSIARLVQLHWQPRQHFNCIDSVFVHTWYNGWNRWRSAKWVLLQTRTSCFIVVMNNDYILPYNRQLLQTRVEGADHHHQSGFFSPSSSCCFCVVFS